MSSTEFERVMTQWCCATGHRHVSGRRTLTTDVDGVPLEFVHGGASAPDTLFAFLDFGYALSDDIYQRLLEFNAPIAPPAHGYFALHPVLQTVIFRVNVPLDARTDGGRLWRAFRALVRSARQALRE